MPPLLVYLHQSSGVFYSSGVATGLIKKANECFRWLDYHTSMGGFGLSASNCHTSMAEEFISASNYHTSSESTSFPYVVKGTDTLYTLLCTTEPDTLQEHKKKVRVLR